MGSLIYRVQNPAEYEENARSRLSVAEGMVRHVYVDVGGVPSTANGKALVVYGRDSNGEKKWLLDPKGEEFLQGVTGSGYTQQQRETLQRSADNLNASRPGLKSDDDAMAAARKANVPMFYTPDVSSDNTIDGYKQRTYKPDKSTFGVVMDDNQIAQYSNKVYKNTESEFTAKMASEGIAIPPSKERQDYISIYHQNPALFSKPEVLDALKKGDRQTLTAIFEDEANMPKKESLRQRRKEDVDLIGRPNDPEVIRHENNSQSELDGRLKTAQQVTSTAVGSKPVPQSSSTQEDEDKTKRQGTASILDYFSNIANEVEDTFSSFWRR